MGLASAYAQFLSSKVHGWLLLIAVCVLLSALTVGAVILVKRVRSISLPWALLTVVLAAVGGGSIGYLIRGDGGPVDTGQAAPAPASSEARPVPSAGSAGGEAAQGKSGEPGKRPSASVTTVSGPGPQVGGKFENPITSSTGCLTGLRFAIDRGLPAGKRVWVMVYNVADETEVYPERKLEFAGGGASVEPFPLGSEADPAGTEFVVLGVLLDATTSDGYERQAASAGTLPVESATPGRVLDRFSVSRDKAYAACR